MDATRRATGLLVVGVRDVGQSSSADRGATYRTRYDAGDRVLVALEGVPTLLWVIATIVMAMIVPVAGAVLWQNPAIAVLAVLVIWLPAARRTAAGRRPTRDGREAMFFLVFGGILFLVGRGLVAVSVTVGLTFIALGVWQVRNALLERFQGRHGGTVAAAGRDP